MAELACVRYDVRWDDGRWVDVDLADDQTDAHLDALVPDWEHLKSSFLADGAPVGYLEHEDGLFLAFRGVDLNPGGIPEDLISVRAWVGKDLLLTASRRETRSGHDLRARLKAGWQPEDPAALLFALAKRLAYHMAPLQKEFEDQLDAQEDEILTSHDATQPDEEDWTDSELARLRREVLLLRRRILALKRGVMPQVELLDDLEEEWPAPLVEDVHEHLLQEARLRFSRHLEDLEGRRDRSVLLGEELANLQAERTARRSYVFTVVAGVFLPLGLITGLLGINVGGMPGAEDPTAFWWVTAGLVVMGLGLWWRLHDR